MLSLEKSVFCYSSYLYLSNCDLINKTSSDSLFKKPRVDKVILNLLLSKSGDSINQKVESFLMLYLFGLQKSFLTLDYLLSDDSSSSFKLKTTLRGEKVELFLASLLVESGSELVSDESLDGEFNESESLLRIKSFILKNHLNLGSFFELEDFVETNFLEPKLKGSDLTIKVFFKGYDLLSQKMSRDIIKTIPFFWISC